MGHLIKHVIPSSIAETLGITPGDRLLSVNGQKVKDVLDYRYYIQDAFINVEIQKKTGEIKKWKIHKAEDKDLGLCFKRPLMDRPKNCRNHCIFCFIDQLPPDLRGTLYVKDDDPRLSFLTGNYITLTNLSAAEIKRVAYYHLSPLHISVHATEPVLRRLITRNPNAGKLMKALKVFKKAGITLHFQVVLCKGVNDGIHLDRTIKTLLALRPNAVSLSVVPAGLTRYRDGLFPLKPFSPAEADEVIRQVYGWQQYCRKRYNTSFVFCADEFYVQACVKLPRYKHYEGFPQLENGVGMMALFKHDFIKEMKTGQRISMEDQLTDQPLVRRIGIVTGKAASDFIYQLARLFMKKNPYAMVKVYTIENRFFGSLITVSGLLTGRDVVSQVKRQADWPELIFIPENAFRKNTDIMLDGTALGTLSQKLRVQVMIGSADGGHFYRQLLEASVSPTL